MLFVALLFLFFFPRPSPPWVINVIIIIIIIVRQSCVAFKFPPITGSTEEATCRRRGKRRSLNHGLHRKDHSWSSRERAVLVAVLVVEGGKEHGGTDPSGLSCQRRLDLAAPGHGGRLRVVPSVVEPSNHHPQWRTRTALLRGTSCTLRPHGRCHAAKKVGRLRTPPFLMCMTRRSDVCLERLGDIGVAGGRSVIGCKSRRRVGCLVSRLLALGGIGGFQKTTID